MSGIFIAAFQSECATCPAPIEKGDDAVFVEGEVEHARCPAATTPQPVCSSCWLVHAPGQKECE